MPRAIILVMDSVGIGHAPDAAAYGDAGADTLGHIAAACAAGACDSTRRAGPLRLPNLTRRGLYAAREMAAGEVSAASDSIDAAYCCASEQSRGKDTPSGHWEIAGVPVPFEWGYFPRTQPSFPKELTEALCREAGLGGILGDCHASGTEIIRQFGEQHLRSGWPICYTSADSVFQIAAHEQSFGLDRLYQVCEVARRLVDPYRIGRVIARPFVGTSAADFSRTGNRRDYSVPPPGSTLLDCAGDAGRDVVSIGKIGDIFAHRGTGRLLKGDGNDALFDATLRGLSGLRDGGLLFANFVDFDSIYGHRRDVEGYAFALERFDARLDELDAQVAPDDLVVITADHGCDPTWTGTDHTREQVPLLMYGEDVHPAAVAPRRTFADVAATVAKHLELPWTGIGTVMPLR